MTQRDQRSAYSPDVSVAQLGAPTSKKIFIIGTGRSGTHWLGYILRAHPDIHVTLEEGPQFRMATAMALDAGKKPQLFPQLVEHYRSRHIRVAPLHDADKTHPNIWLSDDLAEAFPEAVFVGIERNPYATVASMLKHSGVLSWHRLWKRFPIPNRFLGISSSAADIYDRLPLAAKCALRWKAHSDQMRRLTSTLKARLRVLSYEELIVNTADQLQRLAEFLELETPLPPPKIKRESIDRWKTELRVEDCKAIDRIITEQDPDAALSAWGSSGTR